PPSGSVIVTTISMADEADVVVRLPSGVVRANAAPALGGYDVADAADAWRESYRREDISGGVAPFPADQGANAGGTIRTALANAGVHPGARITLLPDGAMSLLPVALLRDPQTGRTLLEDYEVTFAPSMRALSSAERRAGQGGSRNAVVFWNDSLRFA